jgi:hypothetical protein
MLAGPHREQEMISYGHAIPHSYCKANRDSEPCLSEGESAFNSRNTLLSSHPDHQSKKPLQNPDGGGTHIIQRRKETAA